MQKVKGLHLSILQQQLTIILQMGEEVNSGGYPALATDPEGDSRFGIYQIALYF